MWHNNRRFYEDLTLGRWARSVTISAGSGALKLAPLCTLRMLKAGFCSSVQGLAREGVQSLLRGVVAWEP